MAQNGPEYPTCVSNSGKNLFPLKIQDNHALLQPKLVFLVVWQSEMTQIGFVFIKSSGCCKMLQNAVKMLQNSIFLQQTV